MTQVKGEGWGLVQFFDCVKVRKKRKFVKFTKIFLMQCWGGEATSDDMKEKKKGW